MRSNVNDDRVVFNENLGTITMLKIATPQRFGFDI
jgi:hypothetical protein